MKIFTKKQVISLLLILAVLFSFVPFSAFTSFVHATTEISEIRLTSSTTSVQSGVLPEFSVSTTTQHVTSIDSYGSNTNWNYRGPHDQVWKGFGNNEPTAVEDGVTHYGLNICVNIEEGYALGENTKIYFNDVDVTSNGYTKIGTQYSWGGRLVVDLGTAGKALEIYTITYDANGGSGTMQAHTATQGVPEKLRPCEFTPPEGKVFDSWEINGVSGWKNLQEYTFTSDTTVTAVWKDDNYIRTSSATMTPDAINSDLCANDLVFTSSEPSKYSVALWRVYDFTDLSQNTTYLNEYPHDKKFIEGHVYSIEMEFTAIEPYEYDVSHEENGSRFYINEKETVMSKAVDLPYSNLRRTERTAVAPGAELPTHTVTFNLDGGTMTSPSSVVVNDGSKASRPAINPKKDGNTFAGWYTETTFVNLYNFDTPITADIQLYAKWTENEPIYTLTYDFNGGSRSGKGSYVEQSVAVGIILSKANLIDSLGVTVPNGKELDAVMINETRYELDSTYYLNKNSNIQYIWKDIIAETFSVTFDLNYDGAESFMTIPSVTNGSKVNSPNPDPTRPGFAFEGWYMDQTCSIPFDFENGTITANTIIYAKWKEANTQKITLQLDGATVSNNIITFNVDGKKINATASGTNYAFDGTNLIVDASNINNLKIKLDNNFDKSRMNVNLNGKVLAVNGDNEITFGGLNFEDDAPHLQIQYNNSGNQQVGGTESISFNVTWTDTYAMVDINGKEVLGDSDAQQDIYTFNNILIEEAGETDQNKTNVIKVTPRFGDHDISECTINNIVYNKNSENVKIYDYGWFITVPGAAKYTISATGDASIPTPKTIIWVNPDYVPTSEEDAQWVSDFTISHGSARVIEVYDENNNLVDPNTYISIDADEYGLDDGFGWVAILPGSRVVFEFIPEYGYQLTGIAINEMPLDAIEDMNRFEVYIPNDSGNLHFAATFTKTEDIVKTDSKKVKSGEITLGKNLDSGSAQLTVNDANLSSYKIKGFENAAGEYTISNYLDIDLYNVFYKGKNDSEDVWSNKIDELEKEATITLKLADGLTADDIVIVHNVHDGDIYEIIKIESYDQTTNTITFKTKSFSNYAIATKAKSTSEDTTTKDGATDTTKDNTTKSTSESITKEDESANTAKDNTAKSTSENTAKKGETTNITADNTINTNESAIASKSPKTGDNITMWIGLMLVSILGVFGTYKYLRNRD